MQKQAVIFCSISLPIQICITVLKTHFLIVIYCEHLLTNSTTRRAILRNVSQWHNYFFLIPLLCCILNKNLCYLEEWAICVISCLHGNLIPCMWPWNGISLHQQGEAPTDTGPLKSFQCSDFTNLNNASFRLSFIRRRVMITAFII